MKHIQIITTGGTIAMKTDPLSGGLTPAVTGKDLAAAVPGLQSYAEIDVQEFSNVPSGYMTPRRMLELAHRIDRAAEEGEADGFVVTHGTDTLEETAFFLEAALRTEKPVCVTGAMRGASDVSADGPGNILAAVRTAADDKAVGMGVMVVMNDHIHAAWDVTKTHTTCTDTFQSPQWGPLGTVYSDDIVFGRQPVKHVKIHADSLADSVWLLTCVSGMDGELFRLAGENGADGVVAEGLGCGNVPPKVKEAILELRKKQIPVVLVSRVPCGSVKEEYGYDGSARSMKASHIILGGSLSGPKARLLLMLALGAGHKNSQLQRDFQDEF